MKIQDYKQVQAIMAMFKGEPKSGKSTAIASFPEPIYIMDTDFRMATIANHPELSRRDIEFDSFDDLENLYIKLETLQQRCDYKTIAVDSLTSLARLTQSYIFNMRGTSNAEYGEEVAESGRKTKKKPPKIGMINLMGIGDYSGESSALSAVCTKLRIIFNKHKVNTILTAHIILTETTTLDNITRQHRRIVTGGNKIAAEIPGYFNEVYHFEVDTGITGTDSAKYLVRTVPSADDFAGTSFYGLPAQIDFTNKMFYDELMNHILGGSTELA